MPNFSLRHALPLAFTALLSTAACAADAPKCTYLNIGELPLRYLGDSFQPAIDGFINGKPAPMLVDTGSFKTLLTSYAADRLELRQRATNNYARGIGGETRLYSVRVDDLVVGPTHTGKRYLDVIGEMGAQPEFDALVGADFLFQSDFEISLAEKTVRFFRPNGCTDDSYLAYWGDAVEVPFTGSFGESKNRVFTIELNGVKLDAVIDSGASSSFVYVDGARKAGVNTDSAGTIKAGTAFGIGADRPDQWRAVFKTLKIGGETIRDAEIRISAESNVGRLHADVLLGSDFLRAHRVLFAMSQQRLYISYLGGDIFSRGAVAIEPWLQKEADEGNPYAQFVVGNKHRVGSGVTRDPAKAADLLQKAARQGHIRASYQVGTSLLHAGKFAESAELFRNVLRKRPNESRAALYLYLAQLQAGDAAAAARELEANLAADKERNWPAPVADLYLGRADINQLIAQAGKDRAQGRTRACEAKFMESELIGAQGDKARAKTLADAWRGECSRPAPTT